MSAHPSLSGILGPLGDCLDAESARRVLALKTDPAISERVAAFDRRINLDSSFKSNKMIA